MKHSISTVDNVKLVLCVRRAVAIRLKLNNAGILLGSSDANEGNVFLALSGTKAVAILILYFTRVRVTTKARRKGRRCKSPQLV